MSDVEGHLPLTPKMFHILLGLADGPRNGYQVSSVVEENSQGKVRLSPATQYENLHRLATKGLVQEARNDPDLKPDGRGQRFWQLTDLGARVLKAEVERLSADVKLALTNPILRAKS